MARVLVVEDEETIAMVLQQTLEFTGHKVSRATNGRTGLAALQSGPAPDLVLVDLFMPVMNGRAMLEAMRTYPELAQIPAVLVTGAVPCKEDFPPESTYQALIAKPFSVKTVVDTVNRLLTEVGQAG